jgi:hypothetical protein
MRCGDIRELHPQTDREPPPTVALNRFADDPEPL